MEFFEKVVFEKDQVSINIQLKSYSIIIPYYFYVTHLSNMLRMIVGQYKVFMDDNIGISILSLKHHNFFKNYFL